MSFSNKKKKMFVIVSGEIKDGKNWIHVSVSERKGSEIPKWYDIVLIKNEFIGEDKVAYQIFPKKENYVNLHNVLHLWHCIDEDPIPEFSDYIPGTKIRSI